MGVPWAAMTARWTWTDTPGRRAAILVAITALLLNIVGMHSQLASHPPEVHASSVAMTAAPEKEASTGNQAPRDHNGCLFMGPMCAFGFVSDGIVPSSAAEAPITFFAVLDAAVSAPTIRASAVSPPLPPPLYALSALLL